MLDAQQHLSDEDLILAADGEAPSLQALRVRAHLAVCPRCRKILLQLERASADFARAHRETFTPHIPSGQGPRALLRARLAEIAQSSRPGFWPSLRQRTPSLGWAAVAAIAVTGIALGSLVFHRNPSSENTPQAAWPEAGLVPNRDLTPGATRPVSLAQVCSAPHEEVVKEVSPSQRASVFEEYGIRESNAEDYEVDYLIAPGLGGTDDIHNLWPEPYRAGTWDAHVKDALEERLHQLVCARQLDLQTAQRAIAGDWISAYKKYFATDTPQFVAAVPQPPLLLSRRTTVRAG